MSLSKLALTSLSLLAVVRGQQAGTLTTETHPTLNIQTCSSGGTCTSTSGKVVLDSNWRWLHSVSGSTNCYTGNTWDATLCPDATTCAANCALDGADYSGTYGITTSSTSLTLKFVTATPQGTNNIGSRVYLMDTDTSYREFQLLNNEFTFDVDVSNLPCGLNGALYFTQMDADGGMAKHPTNKAGAKYGTGYCDAQCPQDLKFINGQANNVDWTPSTSDPNSGTGTTGACCTEMDIWEANINDQAYTPHLCTGTGLTPCTSDTTCGNGNDRYDGICDKDGCDFNPYRLGNHTFFGAGDTVDSSKPFTVVTQFITSDGTSSGALTKIARLYVQNGKVIQNAYTDVAGVDSTNVISDTFCNQEKAAFGDTNYWKTLGGMPAFSKALQTPMVLVMSIWDDHAADMLWLDSTYPTGGTAPGDLRGPCDAASGVPATVEKAHPGASVTFSNIKFGPIGSTYSSTGSTGPSGPSGPGNPTSSAPSTGPTGSGTVPKWGQCGGQGYSGPTQCAAGSTCTYSNPYYSQCL